MRVKYKGSLIKIVENGCFNLIWLWGIKGLVRSVTIIVMKKIGIGEGKIFVDSRIRGF